MKPGEKQCIGKGAHECIYVEWTGHSFMITTERDGWGATNCISLDLEVYESLVRYVEALKAMSGAGK